MTTRKQLGQLLVEAGIITSITLERALERQIAGKRRLGAVLHEMGVVTEDEVRDYLARQFGLRIVKDIAAMQIPQELLLLIPVDLAVQKLVFPLAVKAANLAVAITDPLDYHTTDFIAAKTGKNVVPVLATQSAIMAGIQRHYLRGTEVPGDRPTVLVVEDSEPVAALIRSALEKEGYAVSVGRDGIEGIKMALELRPRLVVCDSVMPRMDGFGLLRALKENRATATIPVILLTSRATPEHEQVALESGFYDFVPKPVQPVRIVARVKRALEAVDMQRPGNHPDPVSTQ